MEEEIRWKKRGVEEGRSGGEEELVHRPGPIFHILVSPKVNKFL